MSSPDLIRSSLSRPIDWSLFEKLAGEILAEDDFPNLRTLGGVGDDGVDAYEEKFFEDKTRETAVVQVSSEKTQLAKFKKTVKRLRKTGKPFNSLVIVFRQPIETGVRNDINKQALADGISVDIRDEDYLVRRLGRKQNGIYSRYFGDVRQQVQHLLQADDPLETADDQLKRAVLASLSAYVLNPAARTVLSTLFDRTVLAAAVALGRNASIHEITQSVASVVPGESVNESQVQSSLTRLKQQDLVVFSGNLAAASTKALESVTTAMNTNSAAIDRLRIGVVLPVAKKHKLDDASKGRLERNIRRVLIALFRRIGPSETLVNDLALEVEATESFIHLLSDQLPTEVAHTAVTYLYDCVVDEANIEVLAQLARSYTALALRNFDPLGRRFQQVMLARSTMTLDTDALLLLVIEDLPDHRAFKAAIKALANDGVQILVPRDLMNEAVGHISRANKSFQRFGTSLSRMPEELADTDIWHALVRGYYWFLNKGGDKGFRDYFIHYYDADRPEEYFLFMLENNVKFTLVDDIPLSEADAPDFESLLQDLLHNCTLGERLVTA